MKNFTRILMGCLLSAVSVVSASAADKLFMIGDALWGNWTPSNSVWMVQTSDNVFKATIYLDKDAAEGFKLMTETDWGCEQYRAGDEGVVLTEGQPATLVSNNDDNGADKKFSVSESANYDVVCNLNDMTITATKAAYQENPIKHNVLWLYGSATPTGWSLGNNDMCPMDWDEANPMVFTAKGVELNEGELKFACNKFGGFDQTFYQRNATDPTKVVFGGDDNKWNIEEAGKYDITLNVADMTISIVKSTATGISSVEANTNAPVEYFTLDGKRVSSLGNKGVYIKRQGSKATKVVVSE